jgi:sugar phosphate permease
MAAGTLMSYLLCAALIEEFGWHASFYVPAVIAAVIAFSMDILTTRIERKRNKTGIDEFSSCR